MTGPQWVRYSGAITAESARREQIVGLEDVALRVRADEAQGRRRRAGRPRAAAPGCGGSSGGGWTSGSTPTRRGPPPRCVERVRPLLPFAPSALEQPVPHAEVDALAELRPRLGVPVMLDESLCGYPDADPADRAADGRPVQRPALEVRRDRAEPPDHRPGAAVGARACSSAATRARPACSRPRAGTSPAWSGASATSRARTTATSSPPT